MVDFDEEVWDKMEELKLQINKPSDVTHYLRFFKIKFATFEHVRGDLIIKIERPWYLRRKTLRNRINRFVIDVKKRLPYHIRLIINGVER